MGPFLLLFQFLAVALFTLSDERKTLLTIFFPIPKQLVCSYSFREAAAPPGV